MLADNLIILCTFNSYQQPASFFLWKTASSLYQQSLVVPFPHLLPNLFVFLVMAKVPTPIALVLFLLYY
jgi:hypothetical protein